MFDNVFITLIFIVLIVTFASGVAGFCLGWLCAPRTIVLHQFYYYLPVQQTDAPPAKEVRPEDEADWWKQDRPPE